MFLPTNQNMAPESHSRKPPNIGKNNCKLNFTVIGQINVAAISLNGFIKFMSRQRKINSHINIYVYFVLGNWLVIKKEMIIMEKEKCY